MTCFCFFCPLWSLSLADFVRRRYDTKSRLSGSFLKKKKKKQQTSVSLSYILILLNSYVGYDSGVAYGKVQLVK